MEDLDIAPSKIGESAQRIVDRALDDARRRQHSVLGNEHLFVAFAQTEWEMFAQVMRERRGVCQDFAHVMVGCLRSIGLGARYVSGYLETMPPPGQPRLVGSDASHAWVAVFFPGLGWLDLDPTNALLPNLSHITVAFGRDFSDVSLVKGVVLGGGRHQVKVGVDVQRLPD